MKVSLFILLTLCILTSCVSNTATKASFKKCIITDVKYYASGERHTLQIDPEWKITTSCNMKCTLHHKVSVGDTLLIKTVHYK